jgi:hypothetical protein
MLGKCICVDKQTPSITQIVYHWHKELSLIYNIILKTNKQYNQNIKTNSFTQKI